MAYFSALVQKSRSACSTPMYFSEEQQHHQPKQLSMLTAGFTGGPPSVGAATVTTQLLTKLADQLGNFVFSPPSISKDNCRRTRSMSEAELPSNSGGGNGASNQEHQQSPPQQQVLDPISSCISPEKVPVCPETNFAMDLPEATITATYCPRRFSGVDLWQSLFGGKQQVVHSDDDVVIKCKRDELQLIPRQEELAILQNDRERKQARRKKARKRRGRKKARSASSSSDEDCSKSSLSECGGSRKDFDDDHSIRSNKRQRSKENVSSVSQSNLEEDDDDDDLISFEYEQSPKQTERQNSKPSESVVFGLLEADDEEDTMDDDEWDVDESDHSEDDHSAMLAMFGRAGGLVNISKKSSTNCDNLNKSNATTFTTSTSTTNSSGLRSWFSCPFSSSATTSTATTTTDHSPSLSMTNSSAVDIPQHQMDLIRYSVDSSPSSLELMTPTDSLQDPPPLSQEEIEYELAVARLVAEANQKWNDTLKLWDEEEEMNKQAAALTTDDEDNNDDDVIFSLEVDQTDSANSQSNLLVKSTKPAANNNTSTSTNRSVHFDTDSPQVYSIDAQDDCRKKHWEFFALDRMRDKKRGDPEDSDCEDSEP